jgi:hypothetical protein
MGIPRVPAYIVVSDKIRNMVHMSKVGHHHQRMTDSSCITYSNTIALE